MPPRRTLRDRRARLEVQPLEARCLLAGFVVTNTNDSGEGSLRAAIELANADPAPDVITFDPAVAGTIELASALPDLSALSLEGPGASVLAISRSNAQGTSAFRILTVPGTANVAISGLTITGGYGLLIGGGISNAGTMTITRSAIDANVVVGKLTIVSGSPSQPYYEPGRGAGIYNAGTMTITDSTISNNVEIDHFFNGGNGIENVGALTINGSTIRDNFGAGISHRQGDLILTLSTVSRNSEAGIVSYDRAYVTSSTVSENQGRGVESWNAMAIASSSVFANGRDGVFTAGPMTILASTIDGNDGHGLFMSSGVTVTNATITDNADRGISLFGEAMLALQGSVLAGNAGGSLRPEIGTGFLPTLGHNLFADNPGRTPEPTDLILTDPQLGPLAHNGGPTLTRALQPGSPAIDQGVGRSLDQRGVPVPQGLAADIGAFELDQAAAPFVQILSPSSPVLAATTTSIVATLFGVDIERLAGLAATFQVTAGPNAGVTGSLTPGDGKTNAQGQILFTYAGSANVGTDTIVVTATLGDGSQVSASTQVLWTSFQVSTLNDSGPGSLRAAIELANVNPDASTITFAPTLSGTITLTTALPDLANAVTITGPGASSLTMARSSVAQTPEFAIFRVVAGVQAMISGLTIRGGRTGNGGGIINMGTLEVASCIFVDNQTSGRGGGIHNLSALSVSNTLFVGNTAGSGGGIFSDGSLRVSTSTFQDNLQGIVVSGNGSVVLSSFLGNRGSAIYNVGILSVSQGVFRANSSSRGGAIYNDRGIVTLVDSTITDNVAQYDGGGIYNTGTLAMAGTTLANNVASFGGFSLGGGIANTGAMAVDRSTLSGNLASGIGSRGGGIANLEGGTLALGNSTLSGNASRGESSQGGGLSNLGLVVITTTTINGNAADAGGDNLVVYAGRASVGSSILASVGENVLGAITSIGHNLFTDAPGSPMLPTDRVNTNPMLGPLADNGGPTFTHALLPDSPAIDAGAPLAGVAVDQRGFARPQGNGPDIGAFESPYARALTPADTSPPTVLLGRFLPPRRPGRIVVTFSEALAPGRARSAANYTVVRAGRDGRFGTRDDRQIAVRSVSYRTMGDVVVLRLSPRPRPGERLQLTVRGTSPDGIADLAGNLLAASAGGLPGASYTTISPRARKRGT